MKVRYRGFEIDAHRAKSLGGESYLYFSIFRVSDWYECESNFSTGTDTVRTWIKLLKERIDRELLDEDPWGEKAQRAA